MAKWSRQNEGSTISSKCNHPFHRVAYLTTFIYILYNFIFVTDWLTVNYINIHKITESIQKAYQMTFCFTVWLYNRKTKRSGPSHSLVFRSNHLRVFQTLPLRKRDKGCKYIHHIKPKELSASIYVKHVMREHINIPLHNHQANS